MLLNTALPDRDSNEICYTLKSQDATKDIPVIFISARHKVSDKIKAFAAGGVGYLTQPLIAEEVLAIVETHLKSMRMWKELEQKLTELQTNNIKLSDEIAEREKVEKEIKEAKVQAEESEEKYRTMYNNAPLSYQSLDENGCFLDINPMWLKTLGYERDEVIGKWYGDFLHPDYVEHFKINFPAFKKRGYISDVQFKLRRKDKTFIYVSFEGCVGYTPEGKFKQTYCVFKDITEQKALEKDLIKAKEKAEESELFYRQTFEKSAVGVAHVKPDGHFIKLNESFCELLGYTQEELLAMNFADLTFPDDLKKEELFIEKIINNEINTYNIEKRYIHKEGHTIWISLYSSAVRDNNNQLLFAIASIFDISDQIKLQTEVIAAKEQAEESEERFNLAMQASSDGIFDWNLETNEIYYSPGWKKMLGYEEYELPNDFSIWENTTDPEDVKKSWELQQKVITKQIDRFVMEFKMKHKDGHWVDILSRAEAIFNEDGKAVRFIGTHTDITERKRAGEKLRNLSEMQSIILRIASEYINMPQELVDKSINYSLKEIGEFVRVDRAYIFEYDWVKNVCNNTFEWCNEGISPEIDNLQNVPNEAIDYWVESHKNGKVMSIEDVMQLPPDDGVRQILEPQGVKSVLALPMMEQDKCIGFIGFDAVRKIHKYSEQEKTLLKIFSEMLVNIGIRKELEKNLVQAKEKAEASENRFRQVSETAQELIWEVDYKGLYTYVSSVIESLIGYTPDEVVGKKYFYDLFIPEKREEYKQAAFEIFAQREAVRNFENTMIHKNGQVVIVKTAGSPIFDDEGNFIGYRGIDEDITERKQAEKALQKSNQQLESLLSISQKITSTIDHDIIMQMIVDNAIRLVGLDTGAVYLKNDDETVRLSVTTPDLPINFPDDLRNAHLKHHPHLKKALRTGKHVLIKDALLAKLTAEEKTIVDLRKLRTILYQPIMLRGKPIGALILSSIETPRNSTTDDLKMLQAFANQAAHIIDNVTNYTSLKKYTHELEQQIKQREKAEQELIHAKEKAEESEKKLIEAQKLSHVGSWEYFIDNDTVNWSKELFNIFERPTDLAVPKYSEQQSFYTKESFAKLDKAVQNCIRHEIPYEIELDIITSSGSVKQIISKGNVIKEKNKIIGCHGTAQDITERKNIERALIKAKEKAEESDRLKTAFLANMSHEIRTPMNGIMGFTELLLEPDLSSEEKVEYISIVHQSGQRMLNTVNDLVEISKIEAGIVAVELEEVDVQRRLDELIRFFNPEAAKKGLKITLKNKALNTATIIKTDQIKLDSIFTNLIKNAIKYTSSGGIQVGWLQKEHFFEFYVKDTGIGIPKHRQEAIFERFVQADIADKMAYQGTGLGLSISKAYIEMLGGKIWVESDPDGISGGKGAVFYFTLPTEAISPKKVEQIMEPIIEKDATKDKRLKILVAEDDEASYMHLSIILEKVSSEILHASNGTEAVELVQSNPDIDVILMDIRMPGIDGYEASRKIREFNKEVVIIAQTAYALSGDREKTLAAGCNDYIAKPVKKQDLLALIRKHTVHKTTNLYSG
ncbi:MAG: PAS domain S-box protein [Bacteroidetes bacterium]|nr:PAS domain S-box protein [Bacteroidota bacterium]MBU1579795.1 PAS domain S-box protein [Bacteroidota bacterium]MBU2558826.1 PAS domain S-box protein [Bacteroidota bacterium]